MFGTGRYSTVADRYKDRETDCPLFSLHFSSISLLCASVCVRGDAYLFVVSSFASMGSEATPLVPLEIDG